MCKKVDQRKERRTDAGPSGTLIPPPVEVGVSASSFLDEDEETILGILLSLSLVLGLMPGMSLTVYADNTETLLTTITPTGASTYNESTAGIVTVTRVGTGYYDSTWVWSSPGSVTVTAKEGYTITKCVFSKSEVYTDTEGPFQLTFDSDGRCEQNDRMNGATSIEVYGYKTSPYAGIKNTTTVVKFADKDWYLTDYDDSTVTLLSKECVAASQYDSNGSSSTYEGSCFYI